MAAIIAFPNAGTTQIPMKDISTAKNVNQTVYRRDPGHCPVLFFKALIQFPGLMPNDCSVIELAWYSLRLESIYNVIC